MTKVPSEKLPDPVPHFLVFHATHFVGTLLAWAFEYFQLEETLSNMLVSAHKFALFGVGLVVLANLNSYLTGCVICARLTMNVKFPNLYADKSTHKDAVLFNCIQRAHANFLESLPLMLASAFFTALIANRPNVAGLMLLLAAMARYGYAKGYQSNDIGNRFPFFLLQQFVSCVGIGYAVWMGLTIVGVGPFVEA